MSSQLEQLKQYSTIVIDTNDLDLIKRYSTRDVTTNPQWILNAIRDPRYQAIVQSALHYATNNKDEFPKEIRFSADFISSIGCEILKLIPGRVSSELDPRISYDTEATIKRARYLISHYEAKKITRKRVLIKIAATWEGIRAAEILEKEGIHCNLTIVVSLPQAIAAANAKVTLISPFVGRITEWYRNKNLIDSNAEWEPGVQLVRQIYHYYKKHSIKTEIMAASFRTKEQVLNISGIDLITIPPPILSALETSEEKFNPAITSKTIFTDNLKSYEIKTREQFYSSLSQHQGAEELLKMGVMKFTKDFLQTQQTAWHHSKLTYMKNILLAMLRQKYAF